jgi:hypothetical protein
MPTVLVLIFVTKQGGVRIDNYTEGPKIIVTPFGFIRMFVKKFKDFQT